MVQVFDADDTDDTFDEFMRCLALIERQLDSDPVAQLAVEPAF